MHSIVVLVHSPLVGPLTWTAVSRRLRRRGIRTVLPVLTDRDGGAVPYWVQHASAVARRLEPMPPDDRLLLVGHSGAGPLLPAIGAFSPHPVAGYIFVDAGLPHPGRSPLEEIEAGIPELGAALRADLEAGGAFPRWTDDDLRDLIPDTGLRRAMLAELHPRTLGFFEERHPHFESWPDAPCGYVRLSAAYDGPAREAQRAGWPYREFDAGHFHLLVDAPVVAEAILQLAASMMGLNGVLPQRR
ncbi:MAG: alpha/beta hydrolase [Chloroflexi bacterium]|nr:alpha/beta hydrolase [Chloroflexota bacterium]